MLQISGPLATDGGNTWCNLHIHFQMDPDGFMHELAAQAHLCNWIAKKHALQTEHTLKLQDGFSTQ